MKKVKDNLDFLRGLVRAAATGSQEAFDKYIDEKKKGAKSHEHRKSERTCRITAG